MRKITASELRTLINESFDNNEYEKSEQKDMMMSRLREIDNQLDDLYDNFEYGDKQKIHKTIAILRKERYKLEDQLKALGASPEEINGVD